VIAIRELSCAGSLQGSREAPVAEEPIEDPGPHKHAAELPFDE
jgi:hypothetical protein